MFNRNRKRRLGLKTNLKRRFVLATFACVGLAIAISTPAAAWERGSVERFAVVPQGSPMMEGLTVGPDGKVYVSTFDPLGSTGMPAQVLTFSSDGTLLNRVKLQTKTSPHPSTAMLGLEVIPGPGITNALLVLDFGAGQVLLVDPTKQTDNVSVCIRLPADNYNANGTTAGLNALTFDPQGNVYFSDSFQGIIWRYSPTESGTLCGAQANPPITATPWVGPDPTLLPFNKDKEPPLGVPPFGANGIEFNSTFDTMFVCNTAMDWIVEIPVATKAPTVFTNSINGCDGLRLDSSGNIWAAANQADEIVVVSTTGSTKGKAIAKLGDFDGVESGVTQGLLFPASPAFSPDRQTLYVTNLELDLTILGITQSVDSAWAAKVTQHSIAKLEAQIPQQSGNQQ